MALPPKKNIDFDVYERQDPTTTVDWAGAAADITKTFATIRDTRQARKDDLEKNIEEQRIALNDIGQYDSPTLRQVALDSSQQNADKLAMKADQMRRGLLRPNDLMKFKSNQSSGWTQFKNNAEGWDKKFQEFSTRTTDGLNSSAERELAEMVSTFGNLKNMKFLTDDDGNMSYARLDPKTGEIIPGESVSANEMTNLLNQKINSYNATDAAKAIGDKIGVVITSVINPDGIRTNISTEERARAESDFFNDAENAELIDQYANEMTTNPRDLAVMMVDSDLTGLNGVKYENNFVGGPEKGEDKHAKWAEENSEKDQSLNPYIKWEWNGNSYEPSVSKEQKEAGNDYAKDLIKGTFNIKQTDKSQKIEKTKQNRNQAEITAGNKSDAKSSKLGDYIVMLTDTDPNKREAIERSLRQTANDARDAFNAKVNNDADKLPLISDVTPGRSVIATQADVDEGLAENVGDEFTKDREIVLSDGKKFPIKGSFTEQVRLLEAIYDPNNQLTADDIKKLAEGRGFDLDTEITSREDGRKTSKAAYAKPNYKTDLMISGKDSVMTAEDYMDAEYGYGSGAEFNSSVDSTKGIGDGMINLIKASLDPAMLKEFNTTPGQELSMTFETGAGKDSVTFNFGGKSLTIGGANGDLNKDDLYGGNGYELWQALQDKLLNPAIKKLNKERTGGGKNYEL